MNSRIDPGEQIGEGGTEVPEGQDTSDGHDPDDQGDTEDRDDDPNPNHEAARYRVERNEARAERDELREQLTEAREQVAGLRRSIVERIASAAGLLDSSLLAREGYPVEPCCLMTAPLTRTG